MRRVVSIWLPHWPTDRRRKALGPTIPKLGAPPRDAPLITALHDGNRRVIEAADAAAAALGLRPGMAVAHAMAVVPGLHVLEADPADDEAALERLARWCQRVTPLAAPDTPDGIWLDITGCAHFWGGEQALLDHLVGRLAQDGIAARAAVADTPGAAHAVARHGGENRVVPPGAQADAIASFPVAALRLPADMVATLRRLGFEQIDALARVPRALIARRFGPLPGRRLDQAHGRVPEPLQPLAHETPLQHRIAFLEPLLTADALSTATACLLDPVCAAMERAHLGARRVDLLFERVDGAVLATRIGTARPNRDARHLAQLLDAHLETIDPGLGIDAMRLIVPLSETLLWQQDDAGSSSDVSALVDRLANRLGADRVYRAAPVESDVPERSVRRVPALAQPSGVAWPSAGGAWLIDAPTRLFHPPHPVVALAGLPDHAPRYFTWRRHRHTIRRADGPERIYGEWWRRDTENTAVRDYFRVEDDDGSRFLLFRQGDGVDLQTGGLSWYLQGIF